VAAGKRKPIGTRKEAGTRPQAQDDGHAEATQPGKADQPPEVKRRLLVVGIPLWVFYRERLRLAWDHGRWPGSHFFFATVTVTEVLVAVAPVLSVARAVSV
jgi:hypothetical protein